MAADVRSPDRSLTQALTEGFRRFDALQLVRLLLRAHGAEPTATRWPLRFEADLDAGYPGWPVSRVWLEHEPAGERVRLATADLCIGSAIGPLPEPFLEWLRDLERAGLRGARDFLDLFNHRINVLRYCVRAELEPALNDHAPEASRLGSQLAALMGFDGLRGLQQVPLPARCVLGIGGLLAGARRSAVAVQQVLAEHLRCNVEMRSLVGAWRPMEAADRHALGRCRLGQDSLIGKRAWDLQARVRLRLGPVPLARARYLLPGGALNGAFTALLHLMLDRRYDAEIEVVVDPTTVPRSYLTRVASDTELDESAAVTRQPDGLRLGQTAWLHTKPTRLSHAIRWLVPAFDPEDGDLVPA